MPMQSEKPCWEIVQCNKKDSCFCAEDKKKSCWEFVKEDNFCSFHICVDCLVYLAKHRPSSLSKEKFRSIMKQRKKNALKRYKSNSAHALICPVVMRPKSILKEYSSTSFDEMIR
jgi:hypothetical protein